MKHLGLDLGGTKLAAMVLDEAGVPLWEDRWPAPQGSYEGTLEALGLPLRKRSRPLAPSIPSVWERPGPSWRGRVCCIIATPSG